MTEETQNDATASETESPTNANSFAQLDIPLPVVAALLEKAKAPNAVPNIEGLGDVLERIKGLVEDGKYDCLANVEAPDGSQFPVILKHGGGLDFFERDEIEAWQEYPERIRDQIRLADVDSFINYVNRFKRPVSALFGQITGTVSGASLRCDIDYHGAGEDAHADWKTHSADFLFPLSVEWAAWIGNNSKWMDSIAFGQFIEDRIPDLIAPGGVDDVPAIAQPLLASLSKSIGYPSAIVEISKGLRVSQKMEAAEGNNLDDGSGEILFKTENATSNIKGTKIEVPSLFMIGVPVLKNGAAYRLVARLRWRIEGGRPSFRYDLWRPDVTFEHVYDDVCNVVTEGTGLPIFHKA